MRGTERAAPGFDFRVVLDSFSDAVVAADEGNAVVYVNAAAERLLGWEEHELLGRSLTTIIPPRLREAHLAGFARYLSSREPSILGHAVRVPALRADGAEVTVELTLSAVEAGGTDLFVGALRDVRDRLELERETEMTRRLLGVLANAGTLGIGVRGALEAIGQGLGWDVAALWVPDDNGEGGSRLRCVEFWNEPGRDLTGFFETTRRRTFAPGEGLPGRAWSAGEPVWLPELAADDNFPRREDAVAGSLGGGCAFPLTASGRTVGVIELFHREAHNRDFQLLDALKAVAEPLGQFIDNRRAWEQADANRSRLALALEAARMGTWEWHAEPNETRLSDTAMEILGLQTATFRGTPEDVFAHVHSDDRAEVERQIDESLRTGSMLDLECRTAPGSAGEGWVQAKGRVLRDARDRLVGMAGVVMDITGRKNAEADRDRLLREREFTVSALQSSLLPPALPQIPGLALAARYRAAGRGDVGGDFYDVFPVKGGAWGLSIGDVCGKGPRAAAVTAMARYTLRAAALHILEPDRVLDELNHAMLRGAGEEQRFCTIVFSRLEPDPRGRARLWFASGGHPPPVIVRRGGAVERTRSEGFLVGVLPEATFEAAEARLEPEDLLVLYTDGVTEARRGDELFGDRRLWEVLPELAGRDADDAAESLEAAVGEFQTEARDDMAILVVRAGQAAGSQPTA